MLLNYVTANEIQKAKLLWLAANQRDLEHDKEFENIASCLRLFKDDNGLRSKGRMSNASLP